VGFAGGGRVVSETGLWGGGGRGSLTVGFAQVALWVECLSCRRIFRFGGQDCWRGRHDMCTIME